jgi:hypothetical protein
VNIQIIDPIAWVKASQSRFFPDGTFDVIRLLAYVMADVIVLGGGDCRIARRAAWWFVASDADWLAQEIPLRELFQRVVPAPAHGEHSLRAEVLLTAYAQDVYTAKDDDEFIVKGVAPDRDSFHAIMHPGDRLVAFRVPT